MTIFMGLENKVHGFTGSQSSQRSHVSVNGLTPLDSHVALSCLSRLNCNEVSVLSDS